MEYRPWSDLNYLYAKYIHRQSADMNYNDVARELKDCIKGGRVSEIRGLLEPFTSPKEIRVIEDRFIQYTDHQIDPVNYAIDLGKEKVAIYLVEKDFPLDRVYWEEKAVCDEWCGKDHGPDKCPRQYDCCKNAEKHGMEALKLRIVAIKEGRSKPGERISEPLIQKYMPHTPAPKQTRPSYDKDDHHRFVPERTEKSHADEALEFIEKYGLKYATKHGATLLHKCVDKPRVYTYILAYHGVPINIQDHVDGNTALHLAVKAGRADIVEALVQCGADLTLRNKMGQTPIDEAEGAIKTFLKAFEPGVVAAVRDSSYNNLLRHYKRSWCSLRTKVKDGKTLLDWIRYKSDMITIADVKPSMKNELKKETDMASKALQVLTSYRPISELIHAVLCEDVGLTQEVLQNYKNLPVNIRFRDRIGKTLLSHAVETNNYRLVKVLLDHGAKVAQVRVRENEQTDVTVPLFHKALRRDLDVNIVKLLQSVLTDSTEHQEKDVNGNTSLLRAIENGVDTGTIRWLLKVRSGYSLFDRNKDGLTARELAEKRGRDNTVKMIDRYITKEVPAMMLRLFPVVFYPQDKLLGTVDEEKEDGETGDSLQQRMNRVAEQHNVKTWVDFDKTQKTAISLFKAAARGDVDKVEKKCDADYQDRNGYNALTRAIVFNQYQVAKLLCTLRPALRKIGDNCGRFPLHYAYALPKDQGAPFIRLILEQDAKEIENRVDKDGRVAAVYKDLRDKREIRQMLYDARTLDLFGCRGAPLGPWPKDAETRPPDDGNQQREM